MDALKRVFFHDMGNLNGMDRVFWMDADRQFFCIQAHISNAISFPIPVLVGKI